MKRFAFTMMELIFVIIVVGILAATIVPKMERDTLVEATTQVANHIRYAQHLALVDDKYNPAGPTWYKRRWQIDFSNAGDRPYTIFSDTNEDGNVDVNEAAINPANRTKFLTGDALINNYSTDMTLADNYEISALTFGGTCAGASTITFDHLGRPLLGAAGSAATVYAGLMVGNGVCTISLTNGEGTSVISIAPETGYVSVAY